LAAPAMTHLKVFPASSALGRRQTFDSSRCAGLNQVSRTTDARADGTGFVLTAGARVPMREHVFS